MLTGCGSKLSDEELKQLEDLKAEVSSLEKSVASMEAEKQALLKAIADKDAQLAECSKNKDALKGSTGGK
jgi:septal ring factor EnvC (AmiA/AmiB activator)